LIVMSKITCEQCHKDYSQSSVAGGLLLNNIAVGPCCTDKLIKDLQFHNEEHLIRATAHAGQPYKEFVAGLTAEQRKSMFHDLSIHQLISQFF